VEQQLRRRRTISAKTGLVLFAMVLVLVAVMVAAYAPDKKVDKKVEHPTVSATQSCDSCKEAPQHDYKHKEPYTGQCETCHTTSSWRIIHYSHPDQDFNISMHGVIGCTACHTEGDTKLPSTACETCHQERSPHKGKTQRCAQCHTPLAWSLNRAVPSNHVSLEGGHAGLSCFMCHSGAESTTKTRTCVDCHGTNHGGLTKCQDCHDPALFWKPKADFDHGTFFKLEGAHAKQACTACHIKGKFAGTPKTCVGCHGVHHGGLTNCAQCHTPANFSWTPKASFNHSTFFKLEGAHAKQDCTACHTNGKFAGTPKTCVGCHGTHHGGLTNCAQCHTPKNYSWTPKAGFDHSTFFKLEGRHLLVQCAQCHPNGRFAGTPTTCVSCHGNHHGLSALTDCSKCHSPLVSWTPIGVDHSAFPLTGKHKTVSCSKCHSDGVFAGKSHDCVSCHGTRHGGLTSCASCHTTAGFESSTFDHSTKLALLGAHAKLACSKCHPSNLYANLNPDFTGTGPACTDCHASRHGSSYTSCTSCHTLNAFVPTKAITHPAPIVLGTAHASRSCKLCHPTLLFDQPTTDCVTCHAATIPHVGPTDCLTCHRPTTWAEVHFTHVEFPYHVAGPQPENDCTQCHTVGDYSKYSCDACHAPGTVSPSGPTVTGLSVLQATLRTLRFK